MNDQDKSHGRIEFSLLQDPSRKGWPPHGAFAHFVDGHTTTSPPFFSVEIARSCLVMLVNDQVISSDRAAELEAEALAAGLPLKKTRYDRLLAAPHISVAMTEQLIAYFSGALPPEPGSGPARFVLCREGQWCGQPNCHRYPPHGIVCAQNVSANYSPRKSNTSVF